MVGGSGGYFTFIVSSIFLKPFFFSLNFALYFYIIFGWFFSKLLVLNIIKNKVFFYHNLVRPDFKPVTITDKLSYDLYIGRHLFGHQNSFTFFMSQTKLSSRALIFYFFCTPSISTCSNINGINETKIYILAITSLSTQSYHHFNLFLILLLILPRAGKDVVNIKCFANQII